MLCFLCMFSHGTAASKDTFFEEKGGDRRASQEATRGVEKSLFSISGWWVRQGLKNLWRLSLWFLPCEGSALPLSYALLRNADHWASKEARGWPDRGQENLASSPSVSEVFSGGVPAHKSGRGRAIFLAHPIPPLGAVVHWQSRHVWMPIFWRGFRQFELIRVHPLHGPDP